MRGRQQIDSTLHPVRWAAIAAVAIPVLLALGALLAKSTGHDDVSRQFSRGMRWAIVTELILLVMLAATGMVYERRAREKDAQLYRPPGKLVDIGGYRLHLNCAGSGGPTVVLEYGHQATYLAWYKVQPEIASFARVCYYDRAGYGWSEPSPRPRIPSVMAGELHSLLHAAGEKPPYILVAHSLATYDAVMFTHKFPDEVAGLVLVDGLNHFSTFPFGLSERLSLRGMQFVLPFGLPRWRDWCGGSGPQALRPEKQAISCRPGLFGTFYRERAAFGEGAIEIRAIPELGSVPLIVIAHDPKIGTMTNDLWHRLQDEKLRLSKNSELMIATGSDHDVPANRPDLIVAAVRKLVTQSPGTGGQPGNSVR